MGSVSRVISYAQNFEDIVLKRIFSYLGPSKGKYIDVGARHSQEDSVTYLFHLNDWTGINIEPDPYLFDDLDLARIKDINLNCAVSDDIGTAVLHSTGRGAYKGLSTLDNTNATNLNNIFIQTEEVEVNLKSLNSIIEENNWQNEEIHFLKIDVEGSEFKVLKSIDLQKYRPIVLVVESTMPMTTIKNHMIFEDYIINNNYTFCLFDGLNRFYVANERSDLFEIASYPVCIFDHPFVQKYH